MRRFAALLLATGVLVIAPAVSGAGASVRPHAATPELPIGIGTTVLPAGLGTVTITVQSASAPKSPTPDDASGCTGTEVWDNITNCISISGSGLHVSTMKAIAFVNLVSATIHVELSGPASILPLNTDTIDIKPGQSLAVSWSPNANVAGGQYCATTWQGSTPNGPACETVS